MALKVVLIARLNKLSFDNAEALLYGGHGRDSVIIVLSLGFFVFLGGGM